LFVVLARVFEFGYRYEVPSRMLMFGRRFIRDAEIVIRA